ncbi:SRPBCC family protein [uncultured Chloroflexus sp.]|uniref:SRPBCC family protein n=1 Tax=uncultured Chloroflexus sp. TaxID=214040 RepID=UPI00261D296A|nr:SRPBCC family protein [uncultured Chloroflexus sp.]
MSSPFPYLLEEFVMVNTPMDRVEQVMTDQTLMERWMSPAVQFTPLDGWRFDVGAPWRLRLTGVGPLLEAGYVVAERRPGLVLWAFDGFWEGFDAWHWLPWQGRTDQTLIQNRIEYRLKVPGLDLIWPLTIAPLMQLDAKAQMQRLKVVCERG